MRVGILRRGDRKAARQDEQVGLRHVFEALAEHSIRAEPVVYADDAIDEVKEQLLQLDGVLVWVDPISNGLDRSSLDPLLRDVSSQGVWVGAHPDVILKMGTKDVLVKTRDMEWGTDSHLHATAAEMRTRLPRELANGPRVLKQHRGNGGDGVWKVELLETGTAGPDALVRVLHAQRGSALEEMRLEEFVTRCESYFGDGGCIVDQPYQSRLDEGMIRCYLVRDRVVGFGHQFVTALLPPPPGTTESPPPPPRLYFGPDKPEFQPLKRKLESGWVAEMQRLLDLDLDSLPALWDADFLYGPKDRAGRDTFALCEINVSSVYPFPDEALEPLAEAVRQRLRQQNRA